MKKLSIFILFALFANGIFSQTEPEYRKVEGKDYRVYKVEKGDTWYAIARKFEVSYAELRVANKGADDKLTIGKELLVPAKLKPNDPYFQKNIPVKTEQPVEQKTDQDKIHVVQQSQTLFSISKLHGISVEQLKSWNNLSSNSISVGQKLIVGKATPVKQPEPVAVKQEETSNTVQEIPPSTVEPTDPDPAPVTTPATQIAENIKKSTQVDVPPVKENSEIDTSMTTSGVEEMVADSDTELPKPAPKNEEAGETKTEGGDNVVFGNGMQQVTETGIAAIVEDGDSYSDKYYALHKSAEIGTVIRVLNMSNSRKIYVKVTGRLTNDKESILIRLSKASAEKLGMTEKTTNVHLLYGSGQ